MLNFPAHWQVTRNSQPINPVAFADTEPMPLELALPDTTQRPFREALRGLDVRELAGEEFFRLFFGTRN
jgi:hypothetical protein